MLTFEELRIGLKADLLHVPALMAMLRAIDDRFPDQSPLSDSLVLSPLGMLHIDFERLAGQASDTPSNRLLIKFARNLWSGDVEASAYEVLHRCEASRVEWVMLAMASTTEFGHGPATDEILECLKL